MRYRVAFGAAALFALPSMSHAADLSPPAVPGLKDSPIDFPVGIWQGFYAGAHAGASFSDAAVTDSFTYHGDPTVRSSITGNGLIGGGQAGYNLQKGIFIFGLEADLGYLNLSANKTVPLQNLPGDQFWLDGRYSSSGALYGDLTGRLGFSVDRALIYAKGGLALLSADFQGNYTGGNCTTGVQFGSCVGKPAVPSTFHFDKSDNQAGWTAGAGIEYSVNPAWSLKIEYQHFDFGSLSYEHNAIFEIPSTPWHSTLTGNTSVSLTANAVTAGVNYHLATPAEIK